MRTELRNVVFICFIALHMSVRPSVLNTEQMCSSHLFFGELTS